MKTTKKKATSVTVLSEFGASQESTIADVISELHNFQDDVGSRLSDIHTLLKEIKNSLTRLA